MKALVTGAGGQLGRALLLEAPADAAVHGFDSAQLDVTDRAAVRHCVESIAPAVILNAAAYTAVDKAETDVELARAVNVEGVSHLAEAAASVGARLIHVSTDFVFNGESSTPYAPDAPTAPLSVYGATKLEGEGAAGAGALVVRTSWVYGPTGGNFVRTMLRLMSEREEVRVVSDQIGAPTYCPGLARALWALARQGAAGVFHYSDAGVASWYDFAVAIQEEALAVGLLDKRARIIPITTAHYPTPARRPHYSVLDTSATVEALGAPMTHWRSNLRTMMSELKAHG